MAITAAELIRACDLALAGDWQSAHVIVQADEDDRVACWVHAVVHRMEGDDANAGYWYRAAGRAPAGFPTAAAELAAIKQHLMGIRAAIVRAPSART